MDLKSKFILLEFRLETLLGHFIKDYFSTAMSLGKTLITNQTGEVLVGMVMSSTHYFVGGKWAILSFKTFGLSGQRKYKMVL